jgi:hypothetical protein
VIEKILPAGVVCVEAFRNQEDFVLFPEEQALLLTAIVKADLASGLTGRLDRRGCSHGC